VSLSADLTPPTIRCTIQISCLNSPDFLPFEGMLIARPFGPVVFSLFFSLFPSPCSLLSPLPLKQLHVDCVIPLSPCNCLYFPERVFPPAFPRLPFAPMRALITFKDSLSPNTFDRIEFRSIGVVLRPRHHS